MRAIIGIGNPGSRYKKNRHNVGFQLLDYIADKKSLVFSPSKFDYYFAKGNFFKNDFVLIKPSTYVNLSGEAVLKCIDHYKLDFKDILVIVDDINLPVAEYRIRKSGGDGGHNGLTSIIYHLCSKDFARIRIGIGSEFEKGSLPDFVLSDFNNDEVKKLKSTFDISLKLTENFVIGGFDLMLKEFSKDRNAKNKMDLDDLII